MERHTSQAIIIGGGATGTGTLRDLAMRGVSAVLIEKDDLAAGTTGRNHGLLHSGARYAVTDQESARECNSENMILKRIARHCVEDTGGLFVTLPGDDPGYHDRLLKGCRASGIDARDVSVKEALLLEPNLNAGITAAIRVPDGTIDPFRLAASNMLDAKEHGAKVFTHTRVTGIELRGGEAVVTAVNAAGVQMEFHGGVLINASGVWGQHICSLAGIELRMFPSKGSMLIIDYRVNNVVVNRCRKPSDGDIIVPGDTVSLIGTTSRKIGYDRIEELTVDDDEIKVLLEDGEALIPNVSRTRALRAYCGVRPLVALSGETDGRDISRGIVLVDHRERDGADGLITIAGGKLMTYRLMAEMAADLACKKLGVKAKCTTAGVPLPGSEREIMHGRKMRSLSGISKSVVGSTMFRHGLRVRDILKKDEKNYRLICECEMVTEGEVEYAIKTLNVGNIIDLRRRTRVGMGPCQGELCAYRSAGLFNEYGGCTPEQSLGMLRDFLEERWKGIKPVLWGDGLRESEFTYWIYQGLLGMGDIDPTGNDRENKDGI
jgi:glycerol-3-phosphate dehydrogenase